MLFSDRQNENGTFFKHDKRNDIEGPSEVTQTFNKNYQIQTIDENIQNADLISEDFKNSEKLI